MEPTAETRSGFYEGGCYESVICEGGTGRAVALAHRRIERGVTERYPRVLELGAGAGQHRQYVTHPYDVYVETDVAYPAAPTDHVDGGRTIRREHADATSLSYPDSSFDRVVTTCLLIHLADPERALGEWRRVVAPGGLITIYVPCDPGIMLRATRALTTARKAAKLGFDGYDLMNAREHHNHVGGLDVRIRNFFRGDRLAVARWPLRLPTWNLNYFYVYSVVIDSNAR